MNATEYLITAIDWVCELCKEQNIKYRRDDFVYENVRQGIEELNRAWSNYSGYFVMLQYTFKRNGRTLKKLSNNFLEYANCRVLKDGVLFSYTKSELDIHLCNDDNTASDDGDREKVIRKVQKLLSMTEENSCTENEALMASMQAQRLLAKHKMTLADIRGDNQSEKIESVVSDIGEGKAWRYMLASCVAQSYCCKTFYESGTPKVLFYGFKDDILVARRVYTYLFTVGNRLANAYVRNEKKNGNAAPTLYSSFVKGFVCGVNTELSKQCTALALAIPQRVELAYAELSKGFRKSRKVNLNNTDGDAFQQGYTEGKRALNAQYIGSKESEA